MSSQPPKRIWYSTFDGEAYTSKPAAFAVASEYVLRDASADATLKVIEDRVAKALDDFIEGKYIVDDLEEILAIIKDEGASDD